MDVAMNPNFIYSEKENSLGWIVFNRPEKRNALNLEMWKQIPILLDQLNSDPEIRVIVLKGKEKNAFIAGADISEFEKLRTDISSAKQYNHITQLAFQSLRESKKPVISMISGFCIGGGCAISINTDIRIASIDSQFAFPPAKLGLAYGYENVRQVVNVLGASVAKEMLFTGKVYNAKEAYRIGLVQELVTNEDIDVFTKNYALEIAQNAPLSLEFIKIAIEEHLKSPENRNMQKVEDANERCYNSADYKEGYNAFLEKRKPIFKGI
jgi:enoyl-CoA hydratase/carnithine racemase